MAKHWLMCAVPSFFLLSHALMGQKDSANSGSWSGVIVNSDCTADEAFAESAKCTENRGPAAKLSLYDDTVRAAYALDPQDQAVGHLGDSVTVEGTLRNNTIQVASIKMLTAIGLGVGQKAQRLPHLLESLFTHRQFQHGHSLAMRGILHHPLQFPVIKQRLLGHQTFFVILKIHAIPHENTHTDRRFTKSA